MTVANLAAKIANKITTSLKLPVQIFLIRAVEQAPIDAWGTIKPNPAAAIPIMAIVESKTRQVKNETGILVLSTTSILILDTPHLLQVTENQGITIKDQIILTDMTTYPILSLGGFIDSATGRPVATEVYL